MPFTGDSSDDSSDGEEHTNALNLSTARVTNSSSDNTGWFIFIKTIKCLLHDQSNLVLPDKS